jgi:hypothetical protein
LISRQLNGNRIGNNLAGCYARHDGGSGFESAAAACDSPFNV